MTRYAAFVSGALLLLACGGEVTNPESASAPAGAQGDPAAAESAPFVSACGATKEFAYLAAGSPGFAPRVPVDYLAVRWDQLPEGAKFSTTLVAESRGAACSGATNLESCQSALAALRLFDDPHKSCDGAGGWCGDAYLVYTRGDEIGVIRTREQAVAFFGAIDTPAEAIWLGSYAPSLEPSCFVQGGAQSRTTSQAIDVVLLESGCSHDEYLVTLRVHPDGRTEELERKSLGTRGACGG